MKKAWSFGKATGLRRGYGVPSIEGEAATDSGDHAWTRTSFNEAREEPPAFANFVSPDLIIFEASVDWPLSVFPG
jgi:hypothetical protein